MRLLGYVSSHNLNRIPVKAFAFASSFSLLFFCVNGRAETGPSFQSLSSQSPANVQLASSGSSSWNDQPSWQQPTTPNTNSGSYTAPSTSRKKYAQTDDSLQPFSPGSNNVAIDVGQVFLMGDLGNKYSDSIGEQIHYTYGVSELFGFDSSLGYSSHSDGNFSMVTALTGMRLNLSYYDKIVPYVIGGLGFYKPTYTIDGAGGSTTASSVLFGLHAGVGIDLELTRSLFFGTSLTLHDVFGSNQTVNNTQLAMGGSFASFLVHAGVTF